MDNIFVERLWRSLKYEEVYLHAYATVVQAKTGIGAWLSFYNEERFVRLALEFGCQLTNNQRSPLGCD